ncbi:MAG: carbohydrate ABC transporter permease [Caldilineaceae bacterium]|nr:carbohydrate ABC transporter permease [Caldilineaceae bacterium]
MMRHRISTFAAYAVLTAWSLVVLFPVWTMLVNSLKPRKEIFRNPFNFPPEITWEGYQSVWANGHFELYFRNSLFVTVLSLLTILLLGSMAAYALANWESPAAGFVYIFFLAGLMIPIRLGTINILQIVIALGLSDTIYSLFPVYIAMGLPITVFILTTFIRSIPREIGDAARVDGANEWRIYSRIVLPLIRPALATSAIFNLIPIWNDLWFPLIFIRADQHRTVMLGASLLFGQYQTDWTSILAVLTLSSLPILILYLLMSKQFIQGLTGGAVKG